MLLGILTLYLYSGTSNLTLLMKTNIPFTLQIWLFLSFFASFAIKIPMWPFHTWLPDAHVEAPTAGSVILAGILLKLGGYGFLRFSLPLFPEASDFFTPFIFILSLISIIYISILALSQKKYKKINCIFFSSSHGICYFRYFFQKLRGVTRSSLSNDQSRPHFSSTFFICRQFN